MRPKIYAVRKKERIAVYVILGPTATQYLAYLHPMLCISFPIPLFLYIIDSIGHMLPRSALDSVRNPFPTP